MKRIALAAALMAAFAGSAMAQSSVTLYGRINTSIENQDNGSVSKSVMQNNASRWGLKGSEDLGGGLNAFFGLESGFGSDTGSQSQPGRIFGRESFVGLESKSLGKVRAGRLFGPLYNNTIDYIGNFNHDTGTTSEDNLWTLDGVIFSNAVEYTTPAFGGFSAAGLVAAGEGTGPKVYQGVLLWDAGTLHIAGGYSETTNPVPAADVKGFAVAASYGFGPFNIGGSYDRPESQSLGTADHFAITGQYNFGASEFHLSYGQISKFSKSTFDTAASQYTIGYNYNLSKRTKLYAFYFALKNSGIAFGGGDLGSLPDKTWSSYGVGVRHNF